MVAVERLTGEVERWLETGGVVVAASERAARALRAAFARRRMAEGLAAWPTPAVASWDAWVSQELARRNRHGLLVMNQAQERMLWRRAMKAAHAAVGLPGRLTPDSAAGLAGEAQRALRLLAEEAPDQLTRLADGGNLGWGGDAGVFAQWLRTMLRLCRDEALLPAAMATGQLTRLLNEELPEPAQPLRAAILLVGFDRLTRAATELLAAWGAWQPAAPGHLAADLRVYEAESVQAELTACARWVHQRLAENPEVRLMVVAPQIAALRGALERALARESPDAGWEFSLGVALSGMGLVRAARLALKWLRAPLAEAEVEWLVSCGWLAADADEATALAEQMSRLSDDGVARTQWDLAAFLDPPRVREAAADKLVERWAARMRAAIALLAAQPEKASAAAWAETTAKLLDAMGWPGGQRLGTVAYQTRRRFEDALELAATLGFDGRAMDWAKWIDAADEVVGETIFAAESREAPVLVTEPTAAAGLTADAIWFLGATESGWPQNAAPHTLLPLALQRERSMAHASAAVDWARAETMTARLAASAETVLFSYARLGGDGEQRPSRLIMTLAGKPQALPASLSGQTVTGQTTIAGESTVSGAMATDPTASGTMEQPGLEEVIDTSQVAFAGSRIDGGAAALTAQSHCAFKAFATTRLGAGQRDAAGPGLDAKQRGLLLHAVLGRVWSGRQRGWLETLSDLQALADTKTLARKAVREVFGERRERALLAALPERFVALEETRLTDLVAAWLDYERGRRPFRVLATEKKLDVTVAGVSVAGVTMRVRLDRVDVVGPLAEDTNAPSGRMLIVDYKTGVVGPKDWTGDRPDDVQLPLYATHTALDGLQQSDAAIEGVVFAKVRPAEDDRVFTGRVRNAQATLREDLTGRSAMVKTPLTTQQLEQWREVVERLADEYLRGIAQVNPLHGEKTCERCGLQAVCRVLELGLVPGADEEEDEEADSAVGEAANA